MQTAYDLLGIRPDADDETIKAAFREAAKLHHPDRRPGDPHAAFRFRQIATANAILRDPARRADYDQWLALERRHIRLERTRNIIIGAISVIVFGAVFVVGSVWIKPRVLTSMVASRVERDAQRGPTEMAAGPPAAPIGAAIADGHPDKVDESSEVAITPHDAASEAKAINAESPAASEPPTGSMPDQVQSGREAAAAAFPGGEVHQPITDPDTALRLDPDRAPADYDEAIRRDPSNPALFHDRGMIWRRKGDLDRALADMDRAIRLGFSDATLYNERGLIWLEKGRYHRAIADFERARKINPDFADASINRDLALRRENEVAHAPADGDREAR